MPENYQVIIQELVRRSNEETRRLRNVEQKLDSLEEKLNVLVENNIERSKKMNTRFADVEVALKSVNNELVNMKTSVEKIGKQLAKFAQRRDLREIERMLELLSPLYEKQAVAEVKVKP